VTNFWVCVYGVVEDLKMTEEHIKAMRELRDNVAGLKETNWWADFWDGKTWQVEGDDIWTHWRPLGPLPGGE